MTTNFNINDKQTDKQTERQTKNFIVTLFLEALWGTQITKKSLEENVKNKCLFKK